MVRVADVVLDLLQGPGRDETGGRDRKDLFAGRGQAGSDPDHVLLGDARLYDLRRQGLRIGGEAARAARVAGDSQHVAVRPGQL